MKENEMKDILEKLGYVFYNGNHREDMAKSRTNHMILGSNNYTRVLYEGKKYSIETVYNYEFKKRVFGIDEHFHKK